MGKNGYNFLAYNVFDDSLPIMRRDGTLDPATREKREEEETRFSETAFAAHALGRPHLDRVVSKRLRNISSLAFGGEDLRSGYLGCLLGDQVYRVDMPVAGAPPVHWSVDLGPLERYC